jgi:hypothetical protein
VLELQDGMTIVVGHSPNASSPVAWARLPSKSRPVTSQWSPTRTVAQLIRTAAEGIHRADD